MNLPTILLIIFLVTLLGFTVYKKQKLSLTTKKKLVILGAAIVLVVASLLISQTRIAGTIESTTYGWPHSFLHYAIKDIIDNKTINQWSFETRAFLYILANYLFYLSFVFLFVVLLRSYRKNK
ncbi:MAG: hypothetical protein WCW27_06100 [Patescibacteria group bacterium]|jgi:hypothetical protein